MNTKLLSIIEPITELLAVNCKKLEKTFGEVDLQTLVDETCKESESDNQLVTLVASQLKATYDSYSTDVDETVKLYLKGCRMATESSIELEELRLSADRYFQMCERYNIALDSPVANVVTQVSKYANALKDKDVRKLFVQVGLIINGVAKVLSDKNEVKQAVYEAIEAKYGNK